MANHKLADLIILFLFYLTALLAAPFFLLAENVAKTADPPKDASPQNTVQVKPNPYPGADISVKVIPSVNKTYGYDILLYQRPFVHQPNIPGFPGNEGFTTEERARTVAEFVVKKIRNSEMPPTVSIEDLNKMGVLK